VILTIESDTLLGLETSSDLNESSEEVDGVTFIVTLVAALAAAARVPASSESKVPSVESEEVTAAFLGEDDKDNDDDNDDDDDDDDDEEDDDDEVDPPFCVEGPPFLLRPADTGGEGF
jgi:hypothetical protein